MNNYKMLLFSNLLQKLAFCRIKAGYTRSVIYGDFTGKPVDGYMVNRVMGTKELGVALRKAQKMAGKLGYGLLLWDGYRPQCAVNCFLNWASQPEDNLTKKRYYPNIKRNEMVTKGYVASQSSHSRGSAVDLTIFRLDTGMLVPMGGDFDFMDVRSHHDASGLSEEEFSNGVGQLVTVRMDKSYEFLALDFFGQSNIREENNSLYVYFYTEYPQWIVSTFASLGDKAEIIEPKTLRDDIKAFLEQARKQYDK